MGCQYIPTGLKLATEQGVSQRTATGRIAAVTGRHTSPRFNWFDIRESAEADAAVRSGFGSSALTAMTESVEVMVADVTRIGLALPRWCH